MFVVRFQKTRGMAYGKAIQYLTGGRCLQSGSGNMPEKGDVVSLGRKCADGWDAFKRVFTFPHPGKGIYFDLVIHFSSNLSVVSLYCFAKKDKRSAPKSTMYVQSYCFPCLSLLLCDVLFAVVVVLQ